LAQSDTRSLRWPAVDLKILGRLPTLGSVSTLLAAAYLVARGNWTQALGLVLVGIILFTSLTSPHQLGLFAMLAFMGAGMPVVNVGGMLNEYRWAMLIVMAIGLILRNSMEVSGSRWHPVHFSLALFIFDAGLSSSYSVNGLLTLLKAGTLGCLLLGALLYGRLESRPGTENSCKLLDQLYWCALLGGTGCFLATLHLLPAGRLYFQGPFGNPNALGAFIPMVAAAVLLKLSRFRQQSPLMRVAHAALAAGMLVFLLMSISRGGMIATFAACAWWLYFSSRRLFQAFVFCGLLTATMMVAYFPRYVESMNQIYVQKSGNYVFQSRGKLLEVSRDAAKENPLLGQGFGASKGRSEEWTFGFESASASEEKMNSILALVGEVGIVGSVFLLFPIAWIFVTSARRLLLIRKFDRFGGEFWTILTLSACLLGGFVDSMAEAWLTSPGFFSAIMFWLIFGVLSARLTMPFRPAR